MQPVTKGSVVELNRLRMERAGAFCLLHSHNYQRTVISLVCTCSLIEALILLQVTYLQREIAEAFKPLAQPVSIVYLTNFL